MITFINKLFSCEDKSVNFLLYLLLLPALAEARSLFAAVVILLITVSLLIINTCLFLILDKLGISTFKLPLALLLSGAVSILLFAFFSGIPDISYGLFIAGTMLSLYVIYSAERNCPDSFKKTALGTLGKLAYTIFFIVVLSALREILSSGRILTGFTDEGVMLFPHRLGSYVNSISFVLLFLSVLSLIFECLAKKRIDSLTEGFSFKGITKIIVCALFFSVITGFISVPIKQLFINSFLFSKIHLLLPYILAVIVLIAIIPLNVNREAVKCFAILATIISNYFFGCNSVFELMTAVISFAVPSIMTVLICEFLIIRFFTNNKTAITAALVYASIVTLIF